MLSREDTQEIMNHFEVWDTVKTGIANIVEYLARIQLYVTSFQRCRPVQLSSCLRQLVSYHVWIHAFSLHAAPVERLQALGLFC